MRTETLVDWDRCSGCSLCQDACPAKAIQMVAGELGILYPQIDEGKCIDCGLCKRNCPIDKDLKEQTVGVYGAVNSDRDRLLSSASGGVFAALAEYVIRQSGVVYGAAMTADETDILRVRHIRVDSMEKLSLLQKSKYLQSDMSCVYLQIKKDLKDERLVLFSGTPCQNAAVKSFCGKQEKLILVEIVCHGVPSQKLFTDYLTTIQKKEPSKQIMDFRFRSKESGWGLCASLIRKAKDGSIVSTRIPCQASSYYHMFLHCETYRNSCYRCQYAAEKRVGDLTLGDYWGVQKDPVVYDQMSSDRIEITNGISCVIASTDKGMRFLHEASLRLYDTTFESIAKENGQLTHPSRLPETRYEILECHRQFGYAGLERRFARKLGLKKYMIILRSKIPPKVRMRIRMILGR